MVHDSIEDLNGPQVHMDVNRPTRIDIARNPKRLDILAPLRPLYQQICKNVCSALPPFTLEDILLEGADTASLVYEIVTHTPQKGKYTWVDKFTDPTVGMEYLARFGLSEAGSEHTAIRPTILGTYEAKRVWHHL